MSFGFGAGVAGSGVVAGGVAGAGSVLTVSITPPVVAPEVLCVAIYVRLRLVTKKITARTAVKRLRKLADPLAPNRLPEAPLPNAAPMSAPLPCCNNTR